MKNNFYFNQKRNVWDKHYKDYYYGAYGSNLNKRQMSHRCPLAKPAGTAIIRDKQLCFRGVADLEYKKDETFKLGLWKITDYCEQALDRYEGFPNLYIKEFVEIGGKKIMLYVMREQEVYFPPNKGYLDIISDGFDDFKLDYTLLKFAVKQSFELETKPDWQLTPW
jgi:hypothetical protein